jgi:hypothetical protein
VPGLDEATDSILADVAARTAREEGAHNREKLRIVRDFGWEIAHEAVSPIPLYTIVARPHMYTYGARKFGICPSFQEGPFSCRPVPNPNITIRNFFIADSTALNTRCRPSRTLVWSGVTPRHSAAGGASTSAPSCTSSLRRPCVPVLCAELLGTKKKAADARIMQQEGGLSDDIDMLNVPQV